MAELGTKQKRRGKREPWRKMAWFDFSNRLVIKDLNLSGFKEKESVISILVAAVFFALKNVKKDDCIPDVRQR